MACVVCKGQLEKHIILINVYSSSRGRKVARKGFAKPHCPKCKIEYLEDPNGDEIKEVDKRWEVDKR